MNPHDLISPPYCYLCNSAAALKKAGFRQIYPQSFGEPRLLDWWECPDCGGWFVYPVPSPDTIESHWRTVAYSRPENSDDIARKKQPLLDKILSVMSSVETGILLDIGCNFGHLMTRASQRGWSVVGLDPNPLAVSEVRKLGLEVVQGWSIEEAGRQPETCSVITLIDVFCYVWNPYRTLQIIHNLLQPNGLLIMRLTNKHYILHVARLLMRSENNRNTSISGLLKSQFHSVGLRSLRRVLNEVGFTEVHYKINATASPWREMQLGTRLSYVLATVLNFISLGTLNLHPGILLVAKKKSVPTQGEKESRSHNNVQE